MPHIHTEPDQHDVTVSAWIVQQQDGEWKCMVHFHRKIEKLMQIGGHLELDETPWQTMAHELREESGYDLSELKLLQPTSRHIEGANHFTHPVPFHMDTHNVGNDHFHSDICYGFVAKSAPKHGVAAGESSDLRWLTIAELRQAAATGETLSDVVDIYAFLITIIDTYAQVDPQKFTLEKPKEQASLYKRGAVER